MELTAPDSTSEGVTRLGRDAAATVQELGPLADLVGTWIGTHGWELIAVPDATAGFHFRLIVRPYVEVLTFAAIGAPVPNRGGPAGDMFITGLTYEMRVADIDTNEPLHIENGMWLDLGDKGNNAIARLASIPHGDVVLAMGAASAAPGPPAFPEVSALPIGQPAGVALGYTDVYQLGDSSPFQPAHVDSVLATALQDLNVTTTTTLSVATDTPAGGGIVNIPFVNANAATTEFDCTYWIETIEGPTGDQVMQLQYSQQTRIEFLPDAADPSKLVIWPHTNVNTLRKQ